MTLSLRDLPEDAETLKAMILAVQAENARLDAERQHLKHEGQVLAAEVDRLKAQNERLDHIVSVLRRAQFGRRSERGVGAKRFEEDQIELALEDVETQHGTEDAAAEKADTVVRAEGTKARRANRGHLPAHLPREEIVIEPPSTSCPCCGGALHVIGEDVSQRLDKVPARLRVVVTRRPKYACRRCEKAGTDGIAGVIQAPAPNRLIEGGLPTEALVADVLVSKYADHLPLYRQAQIPQQLFGWRKRFREQAEALREVSHGAARLQPFAPVLIEALPVPQASPTTSTSVNDAGESGGSIEVVVGRARLHIRGVADARILALVLKALKVLA